MLGEHQIVVAGFTDGRGILNPPTMEANRVAEYDPKGRKRTEKQEKGNPYTKGQQNAPHGSQGNKALHQSACIFYQGGRPTERIYPGAVQLIIVSGIVIKREIQAHGLLMNELVNMVLHPFSLSGAHPGADALEHFASDQHQGHCGTRREKRRHVPPAAARTHHGGNTVHQRSGEINRGNRQQSLNQQQQHPDDGLPSRCMLNQLYCPRQIGNLLFEAISYVGKLFDSREHSGSLLFLL